MFWLGVGVGRVEEFRVSDEDGSDDGNPRQRRRGEISLRAVSPVGLCRSSSSQKLRPQILTCLSSGTWPNVNMYFRLTPVCFFIAQEKTSATISLSTVSASLVAAWVAGRQAARSTDDAALEPSDIFSHRKGGAAGPGAKRGERALSI